MAAGGEPIGCQLTPARRYTGEICVRWPALWPPPPLPSCPSLSLSLSFGCGAVVVFCLRELAQGNVRRRNQLARLESRIVATAPVDTLDWSLFALLSRCRRRCHASPRAHLGWLAASSESFSLATLSSSAHLACRSLCVSSGSMQSATRSAAAGSCGIQAAC